MKKRFKIYPALFVIDSSDGCSLPVIKKMSLDADERDLDFRKGYPQIYQGSCLYNAERTLVTVHFSRSTVQPSFIDLPETIFTKLEPCIRVGKKYTLTYICVSN